MGVLCGVLELGIPGSEVLVQLQSELGGWIWGVSVTRRCK